MEVFCSRVYTESHFGTQRITLTGCPLKSLSMGARRICPETMFLGQLPTHSSTSPIPFQEGNFYRAFLQKEWNVEFTLCCLWSWFRNTGAGCSGQRERGQPLSKDGTIKGEQGLSMFPPTLGNEQSPFPRAVRHGDESTPSTLEGFLVLMLHLEVDRYTAYFKK